MFNRKGFVSKLMEVDIDHISVIPYCSQYLEHLLTHIEYYLEIYEHLFEIVRKKCAKPLKEISFVDYGCGNGLLGLYAKHSGFREVLLIDNDSHFQRAASALASQLGFQCEIIKGDYHQLPDRKFDAIAGTDVIEHIHDLAAMMHAFKVIRPTVTVFTTASNPKNYFKIRKLKQLQIRDETKGNDQDDPDYGHPPFLTIRRSIIRSAQPEKSNDIVNMLAENTRGMMKEEIIRAMYLYDKEGVIPMAASGTNTCNPLTGSWTERILTIDEYLKVYNDEGFILDLSAGFYNEHYKGFRGRLNAAFNKMIKISGITFAPFIILTGTLKN